MPDLSLLSRKAIAAALSGRRFLARAPQHGFGFAFFIICLLFMHPGYAAPLAPEFVSAILPVPSVTIESAFSKPPELVFGLFIGVMLAASIYLFFIWIVIRDRGQAFLMLLLLCLAINMASTNDQLMDQLGIYNAAMRNLLQSYSLILSYIFSIFFTYYFLEIDVHMQKLKMFLFLMAILLLMLLVYASFDQRSVYFALPTLGALAIAAVLAAGVGSLSQEVSGSLSHIIAFSFFLVGGLAGPLYDLGFFTDNEISKQLTYAAYSMAALMFAIVIAVQFAARQEEKERALAISNERFALAARGSNEGLFDWNKTTGEVFFSDQFKKILGVQVEQSIKGLRTWVRMIVPSDRRIIFAALRRFRDNPGAVTINFEYRVVRKNKTWCWIHTKTVATRDPYRGRIIRFVGSIGDITSRKQGEAALRASEARFRSITEAHPVPVLIVQLEYGQVLYASPGAEDLLGLPHSTLTSHQISRFLTKANERNEIMDAMSKGQEVNLKEVTITRGDGNSLPIALSARRINYQNQLAMVAGLYDLTERKQAEAQIAKQQEALQQSEKMAALGGLLAGVAHELNNPLSVVVGQSTLLIEGEQEVRVKNRAEKIFKAADRCSRIVKSFLALARRKPPERKALDLNSIVHASLELLSYQFRNENVELSLELDPDLPAVMGDSDQLTQVFTNLALNAAQAMHDWQGRHKLTIRTSQQSSERALVTILDTGPGIPPEIRSRVFEPFFTTKGGQGGTGVGLSLCLNMIVSHGGQLRHEDTPGGGATFLVELPTASALESVQEDAVADLPPVLNPLKILIVDDEVELAQTLADLLEPEGHFIDLAANGDIALNKLLQKPFDVIISDLRMPVLDGPALYAELTRILPQYTNRIIYVTGDTLSPHVQSFLSQTPVPVIEKPYRLADVRRALGELLKDGSSAGIIGTNDSSALSPSPLSTP
ncbi:MAG: PAS domain S-box protein [Alphaproteobacteria bacterium]|nr:PAS domain S-box protein [Alphaproteobacteria bacterium]